MLGKLVQLSSRLSAPEWPSWARRSKKEPETDIEKYQAKSIDGETSTENSQAPKEIGGEASLQSQPQSSLDGEKETEKEKETQSNADVDTPSTTQEEQRGSIPDPDPDPDPGPEPIPIANGPPSLNYTLHTRKRFIFFFWSMVLFDTIAVPIVLYFVLWYDTDLSQNAVFSISTAALGGTSILEYILRFWRLWKKGSTCRVIGGRRKDLDWFHWNYSISWIFIMAELIIGTCFDDPPIRLLAMPVSSLCYWFAFQLLVLDTLRIRGYKSHMRISSMPKGTYLRPGIYSLIEDVVAVDGSGGTEFRRRLNTRYEASKDFRMMLHRLTLFWAFGALFAATLTTILVWTVERDAAYVCGWTIPFIWAGIASFTTIIYVRVCLEHEKRDWGRSKPTINILRV